MIHCEEVLTRPFRFKYQRVSLLILLSICAPAPGEVIANDDPYRLFRSEATKNADISSSDFDFALLYSESDERELAILPDSIDLPWYDRVFMSADIDLDAGQVELESSTPKTLLGAFFAQEFCPMPKKLRKRLRDKRDSGNPFMPADVAAAIDRIKNTEGTLFPSSNISNVIHRVSVAGGSGNRSVPVESADTYGAIDIQSIVDPQVESLTYLLDCSGFLTAQAKAGFLTISSDVAGKLDFNQSMLVLVAKVASPIGMALSPISYPVKLPRDTRFGVLTALAGVTIKDVETATIAVPMYFYVVAASAQKGNSLQGTFNASASASIAVISASVGTGIQHNRKISYNNFDTLLLPAPADEGERTITVSVDDIRSDVRNLFNSARAGAQINTIDGRTVVAMTISRPVCELHWELANRKEDGTLESGGFGSVDAAHDGDRCNFTLITNQTGQGAHKAGLLTIHNSDLGLQNTLQPSMP